MAQAGVAGRNSYPERYTPSPVRGAAHRNVPQANAAVRMRKERIARTNRLMLRVTIALIVVSLFVYISRMAAISANAKEIAKIRQEITQLKEEQQYLEVKLAARQDLDRVRDEAMGRLGMRYPEEGQVQLVSLGGYLAGENWQTAHDTTAS